MYFFLTKCITENWKYANSLIGICEDVLASMFWKINRNFYCKVFTYFNKINMLMTFVDSNTYQWIKIIRSAVVMEDGGSSHKAV